MGTAIIIPGLGGRRAFLHWMIRNWFKKYDVKPVIFPIDWRIDREGELVEQIENLKSLVIELSNSGQEEIYLIGVSAGGSLALNVYLEIPDEILNMVNICGRISSKGKPSLERAARKSPLFKESVLRFEELKSQLTFDQRRKVLTFRGLWDGKVPVESCTLPAAINIKLSSIGHWLNIAMALRQTWRLEK